MPSLQIEIVSASEEQQWNDAALAHTVREPSLRIWLYREPAIVLGCAQGRLMPAADTLSEQQLSVLMRRSGGGAVLVGPWLVGLSVCLPPGHPLLDASLAASYRWLGDAHVAALTSLGIDAQAKPPLQAARGDQSKRQTDPLDWACFGSVSAWEVVARDERKLSGFAQIRRSTGALFVGATLVSKSPWPLMCSALGQDSDAAAQLRERTVSCDEIQRERGSALNLAYALSREIGMRISAHADRLCTSKEAAMA